MATNTRSHPDEWRSTDTHGPLECALIDEFLAGRGHTLRSVDKLPPEERRELMRRAASYATLRLAEIEARAHFVEDLERRPARLCRVRRRDTAAVRNYAASVGSRMTTLVPPAGGQSIVS